mmetsp:Transcript_2102/g.10137  ORF Transcript_2102/g.10137 Transcript_2102/m.10137 type:complete len:415 (-) Transcript_2102:25-1269(-)
MHRGDVLIGPRGHHGEELGEVTAHVGIRPVEDVHARDLRRGGQHGLHHVGGRARDGGHGGVGVSLGVQRGVDVDDVDGVLHAVSFCEVVVVLLVLCSFGEGAPDVLGGHPVHLRGLQAGVVQDGSDVLGHEVDAEHGDGLAPALVDHANRGVGHDERVGDEDVLVLLRSRHEHALHLGVHVKVRDDADLLGGELGDERVNRGGVGLEVLSLRQREGALGLHAVGGDDEGRERGRGDAVLRRQESALLLHRLEHVAESVGAGPRQRGGSDAEVRDDIVRDGEDVRGREAREAAREDAREAGGDLRLGCSADGDEAFGVEGHVHPGFRGAPHDAVGDGPVGVRELGEGGGHADELLDALGGIRGARDLGDDRAELGALGGGGHRADGRDGDATATTSNGGGRAKRRRRGLDGGERC